MKVAILVLTAALMAAPAVPADSPEDAVLGLFAALAEGNGVTAVSYLSSGVIEELQLSIDAMRMAPEVSIMELGAMGIELTEEQLETLTPEEFGAMVLSTPMISDVVAMVELSVGDVEMEGDSASVEVVTYLMGESSSDFVETVLEDGSWKITEMGL